jgi:signal transduction histidine kinase
VSFKPSDVEGLERALSALPDSEAESAARADLLNRIAWQVALHEPDRTRRLSEEARELSLRFGYEREAAFAIRNLGYVDLISSNLREGLARTKEALDRFRDLGEREGEASALNTMAVGYSRLGDYGKALETANESLSICEAIGDRRGEAWAWAEIGGVHHLVGDLLAAREAFERAVAIFDEIDYKIGIGRALTLLGAVLERMGELDAACRHYERSLEEASKLSFPLGIAGAQSRLAELHRSRGDRDRARSLYLTSLAESAQLPMKEFRARVLLGLGNLELEEGNLAEARERLRSALDLVENLGAVHTEAEIQRSLSQLEEASGDVCSALAHFKRFHELESVVFDEERRARLKNLQIRLGVERAEREAEVHRLRYVELAAMQARLIQSEKMAVLGKLVAGLAHELNTPVGALLSSAANAETALGSLRARGLLDQLSESAESKRAIEALSAGARVSSEASKRISEVVQSLRGFSRIDESSRKRVDLSQALSQTIQLFRHQLPDTVRLVTELAPLPEIECHPGELNQVFMTLLMNAGEAIEGEGTIRVRCGRSGERLFVEISDTGRGIPEGRLRSLFDLEFHRQGAQVRLRMGLFAASSIVQQHGGDIAVVSEPGEGSSFTVFLPLVGEI